MQACKDLGGDLQVLGSSTDCRVGQVVVGSTAEPLLHSSEVSIAIAARGHRTRTTGQITRLTCSFSGTQESADLLVATAQVSLRVGGQPRIVTFGVRGRTMYPPELGLRAEDMVLQSWKEQVAADQVAAVTHLRSHGLLPENAATEIATGSSWVDAMEELEWESGEVLEAGSSPIGPLARVFLGLAGHQDRPVFAGAGVGRSGRHCSGGGGRCGRRDGTGEGADRGVTDNHRDRLDLPTRQGDCL
jgi:hypothetical protein